MSGVSVINRRRWLQMAWGAGAGLFSTKFFAQTTNAKPSMMAMPQTSSIPVPMPQLAARVELASFVDPLPIPPVIRPAAEEVVHMRMAATLQKVHRDLPPTDVWTYNGSWPGPTIEARRDQPVTVKWTNNLPTKHFLPIDTTLHGAEADLPQVRAVPHLHGAQTLPESDGYPEAWSTSDGKQGPFYRGDTCHYPNSQPAATLWYHDHGMGITRLNNYAGLSGLYLIRDDEEDSLNLPQGPFEIPLVIQDRNFTADGSLLYPPAPNGTHPVWMQEFFGNSVCVNGKAKSYLEVEPRKYRFRILNASNARFYHLSLVPADANGKPSGDVADAPPFMQIGTDGGLLPTPLSMHFLIAAPAERFDVVIDFSDCKGQNFLMANDAPAPYTRGGETVAPEVMLFKVTKPLSSKDTSSLPDQLVPWPAFDPDLAVRERVLSLVEQDRASDGYTMISLLDGKRWSDPITEDPKAGSMEIWSFLNTTSDVHPIHTHLVQFQVLNRQPFDVQIYQQSRKLVFTNRAMEPERNERPAWKDTVKAYPGYVTRVIQKFALPPGTPISAGQEFLYVWHCHILEHEDNEMMRPYKVVG
jgi:spore coat protein A, manganese oxidase